ncbi:MAG: hypothetical protein ACKOYM_07625, partial [Actinomycetes bacterium]
MRRHAQRGDQHHRSSEHHQPQDDLTRLMGDHHRSSDHHQPQDDPTRLMGDSNRDQRYRNRHHSSDALHTAPSRASSAAA